MAWQCVRLVVVSIFGIAILADMGLAEAGQTSPAELESAFIEADVNGDGYVDVDEYVAYMVRAFAGLDTDRDGYVVMSDVPDVTSEKFAAVDRNGDGRVSLGEGVGDKMIDFFEIDQDEDGVFTLEELVVYEQSKDQP